MELKRVLNKRIAALFFFLTALSCLMFYREQLNKGDELLNGSLEPGALGEADYDYFDIMQAYDDIIDMYYHARKVLEGRDEEIIAYAVYKEAYNSPAAPGGFDVIRYAADMFKEYSDYILGYHDSIEQKLSNAQAMINMPLFSKAGAFAYNNLVKSSRDMQRLLDVRLQISNTTSFDRLAEYNFIHYMLLIMALFTVLEFMEQRKKGLWGLVYSTGRGRAFLTLERLGTLFILCLMYTALMYGAVSAVSAALYGKLEGLNEPLQGSMVFSRSMLVMSRGGYLIFHVLYCAAALTAFGVFAWACFSLFRTVTPAYVSMAAIIGVEAFCYVKVGNLSHMAALRFFNLFNLINPKEILSGYVNWGNGRFILGGSECNVIFMAALSAVCFLIVLLCDMQMYPVKGKPKKNRVIDGIVRRLFQVQAKLPFIGKELYKLLFSQKGILVLAVYGVLISRTVYVGHMYYDEAGVVLREYYERVSGLDIAAVGDVVSEYNAQYKQYLSDVQEMADKMAAGEIVDAMRYEAAADKVKLYRVVTDKINEQYDRIAGLAAQGRSVCVINEYEYNEMFGEKSVYIQTSLALYAVCAVIFLLFGLFSFERRQGLAPLIRTAAGGRGYLFRNKFFVAAAAALAVFLGAYVPNLLQVAQVYRFYNLNAGVWSVEALSGLPINMPIWCMFMLTYLFRYLLLLAVGVWVMWISVRLKYLQALVVSMAVLAPQFLYMAGLEIFAPAAWLECFNMPYFYIYTGGIRLYVVYGSVIAGGLACFISAKRQWESGYMPERPAKGHKAAGQTGGHNAAEN